MRRGIRDPAWLAAATRRAWSPLDLAPDLWLDASDASTITDAGAGAVSQWRDKSGNARHFAQSTPSARPTTGTRAQNSLNVIDFVRGQVLDGGDILDLGAGAVSIFGVFKFDDNARACPWGKNVAGATDGRYGLYKDTGSQLVGVYDEGPAAGTVVVINSSTAARQISQVLTRAGVSSSHVLRIDGTAHTKTFTDVATVWNTTATWRLGRYGTSTLFDLDGFIAEVIVIMRTATADEITAVEAYLKAKWGTA